MLIYPGAFNMTTGPRHWELLGRARATDQQVWVALVSPARDTSASYVAWGHSSLIDPWGAVVSKLDEKPDILLADIGMLYIMYLYNLLVILDNGVCIYIFVIIIVSPNLQYFWLFYSEMM